MSAHIPRGVQHLVGHAGAAGGVVHIEHVVVLELDVVKAAVQGCGDHGAGVAQLHPLGACSGAAACPAGVHQVDLGAVLVQLVAQHLGVDLGVHGHEGLAKQGGEGGLGLGDAALGAGQLGGEAVTKWYMAASLLRRLIGGRTPKASAVRKMTTLGMPPSPGIWALEI